MTPASAPNKRPRLKYRHIPLPEADKMVRAGAAERYRVVTVNWTYATVRGKRDYGQIHHNVYEWSLRYLLKWIVDSRDPEYGWAEDIVSIEPIGVDDRRAGGDGPY